MLDTEIGKLKAEITALKQALERQDLSSREEEEEEETLLVPEVFKKKIDQLLSTSAKTMRSSTVQNVLKGFDAKVQELERDSINLLQELTEEENKNEDYRTIIRHVEKQTRQEILGDDMEVLPTAAIAITLFVVDGDYDDMDEETLMYPHLIRS